MMFSKSSSDSAPVHSPTLGFFTNTPVLTVLSIVSSAACIIMMLFNWISISIIEFLGIKTGTSIFTTFFWLSNSYSEFKSSGITLPYGLFYLSFFMIFFAVACMVFYIISIYHVAKREHAAWSSGRIAMVFTLVVFFLTLFTLIIINNTMNNYSDGLIHSVVSLTAPAYIVPILALVNFFVFIRDLTKHQRS